MRPTSQIFDKNLPFCSIRRNIHGDFDQFNVTKHGVDDFFVSDEGSLRHENLVEARELSKILLELVINLLPLDFKL